MARMRTIKPSFFTNDLLAQVHPLGRILFAGLWCIADRAGRLEDRPQRIKIEVLPYDKANVDRLLDELASRGFIVRYESGGQRFVQIVNFDRHQSPHMKEPASTIPEPGEHGAQAVREPFEPSGIWDLGSDPDPDLGSGIISVPPTPHRTGLTPEQEQVRVYLHATARDFLLGGVSAPDISWCVDLIERGATESDADFAVQASLGKGLHYARAVLERRVVERENGVDHDQLARDRAAAAARQSHAGAPRSRGVARNGAGGGSFDEFGVAPPHAIGAADLGGDAAEGAGARAPISLAERARTGGGAG